MQDSTRSCSACASFLPESRAIGWRPSRWVIAALAALSVLAPFAVLASEMPRIAAWPLACVAAAGSLALAWRESRRAPHRLGLPAGEGVASLDGVVLVDARLSWRGPLAFLCWRDAAGRAGRLSWWPDTLPAAQRRVLRSWSPGERGMAP